MNPRRCAHPLIVAAGLLLTGAAQAQSVINWPTQPATAATTQTPALPPSIPVLNAAPPAASVQTPPPVASAPHPSPSLPPPVQPATPAPALQAGYVVQQGQEPEIRLDVGRVSPELLTRYAQQPGESQEAYITRMNALYQQTQATLEATQTRNQAYLRSIASQPATTPAPASQP